MDWVGQLDNLTKFLVLLFIGMAGTIGWLWFTVQDRDLRIYQLTREKGFAEQNLETVTRQRDKLLGAVDEMIAAVDEQDRTSGGPWGPSREKIEALRKGVT